MAASKKRRGRNRRKGINPGEPPGSDRINPGAPRDRQITFSFKYLHPKPPVSQDFPDGYLKELMNCLKEISEWDQGEFVGNRSSSLRAHGIDWSDSNIPDGFTHLPKHLQDSAGYQISIERDVYGRVIGLLIGSVFHVCWLDPNHETMGRKR